MPVYSRFILVITLLLVNIYSNTSFAQNEELKARIQQILDWSQTAYTTNPSTIKDSLDLAIKISKQNKLDVTTAKCLQVYIGFILDKVGDFDYATSLLEEINQLAETTNNPSIQSLYHGTKGYLYMYEDADRKSGSLEFKKAIDILDKNKLHKKCDLLNNYSVALQLDGKYREALEINKLSINEYHENPTPGDENFLTIAYINTGISYYSLGKMDSAELFMLKAVNFSVTSPAPDDNFIANLMMGGFLRMTHRVIESIQYLEAGWNAIHQSTITFQYKAQLCDQLSAVHLELKDFEKALHFKTLQSQYLDSLNHKEISEKAFALNYMGEIKVLEQQKKIDKLNLKIKEAFFKDKITAILLLLALVVSSSVFVFFHLNRRRQLSLIKLENERLEKERIKQESELIILRKEEKLIYANVELSTRENELSMLKERLTQHLNQSHDPEFDGLKKFLKMISRSEKRTEQLTYIDHVLNSSNNVFYQRLKTIHPKLTEDETRLAALIRLNLSSIELQQVFNISKSSLLTKRYRFRKKMNLEKNESLENYLKKIN